MFCKKCGAYSGEDEYCDVCAKEISDQDESKNIGDELNTISNKRKALFKKFKNRKFKRIFIVVSIFFLLFIIGFSIYKNTVNFIWASYIGDKSEGIVLRDGSRDIVVNGMTRNGNVVSIRNWKMESPAKLIADESTTVEIKYKKLSTELTVKCSSSEALSISTEYCGMLNNGITATKENFNVFAELKNGETPLVTDDCTFDPETVLLQTDGKYTVTINYTDPISKNVLSDKCEIVCSTISVVNISARYTGDTGAGTMLDSDNDGITVTAKLKNGETEEVDDWTVEKPIELKVDGTAKLKILYEGCSCELNVECSDISEKKYKSMCKSIAYNDLLRNPRKHKGEYIKLTGTVFQVISETVSPFSYSEYLIKSSGNIYYVEIYNGSDENRILEGDTITVWGTNEDIYSYNSVLGSENTVPKISVEYYN